jgi:hypothetical protein
MLEVQLVKLKHSPCLVQEAAALEVEGVGEEVVGVA